MLSIMLLFFKAVLPGALCQPMRPEIMAPSALIAATAPHPRCAFCTKRAMAAIDPYCYCQPSLRFNGRGGARIRHKTVLNDPERYRIAGTAAEAATNRPKVLLRRSAHMSWLGAPERRFQLVKNLLLRFVKGSIE
jgi:hypothetical protein